MGDETYGVNVEGATRQVPAPELAYRPRKPQNVNRGIAVIGCGGITQSHLQAYRNGGFNVLALYSRSRERADARRAEFFPDAVATTDLDDVLSRADIEVLDITTHPEFRPPLVEAALRAGKHVLSQKPLATSLDTARTLVAAADANKRLLAVNQNGRWAPHFSWMREAVSAGLIGEVSTVDFTIHWDHHWIVGSAFEEVRHLVLYDFGVHWFDIASAFFAPRSAKRVYAAARPSRSQRARPPFLAHACVEFELGQATLVFNADCRFGQEDRTTIVGSSGTLRSVGPNLMQQRITLHAPEGFASPDLEGCWFPDGFQGAMAELLCAIDEQRQPLNSASQNLRTLELCLAAIESAEHGAPVDLR